MAFDSSKSFDAVPLDVDDKNKMNELRDPAKRLAQAIMVFCPEGRERALAYTYLEMAMMWASKAITHT